jgi:hypothetical protein
MTKARQNLYLPHDLSDEIDRLAKKPGATKSAVVEGILRSHVAGQRSIDLEGNINAQLGKLGARVARVEQLQLLTIESLANFIRFYFSVLPPISEAEQRAGKTLSEKRFAAFVDQVARRRTSGKSIVDALTRGTSS